MFLQRADCRNPYTRLKLSHKVTLVHDSCAAVVHVAEHRFEAAPPAGVAARYMLGNRPPRTQDRRWVRIGRAPPAVTRIVFVVPPGPVVDAVQERAGTQRHGVQLRQSRCDGAAAGIGAVEVVGWNGGKHWGSADLGDGACGEAFGGA